MPATPRPHASLLLAAALVGPACALPPEFVGATVPTSGVGETGDSTAITSAGETDDATAGTSLGEFTTTASGGTSTGVTPVEGAYGSFCELVGVGPDLFNTAIVPQPQCDGGICLLVSDEGPLACDGDAQCAEEAEGSTCGQAGFCNLSPAFIMANARCTHTCEAAGDCPAIPGCATEVSCSRITMVGPLCCQKVCACDDHIYLPWVESVDTTCEDDPELCMNQGG